MWEKARGQDQAQFEELFRSHYAAVYRALYRLVGDEADDVAQEAFLRLYRQAPELRGADAGPWLYRVAVNLGYNALRGRARRERRQLAVAHDEQASEDSDPAAAAELAAEQALLRRALAALTEREASLLVLHAEGLSYRELAEALGIRPGSVGTLLARAEKALARTFERLSQREPGPGGGQ